MLEVFSHNKSAHNQQEEKQDESWRTPNITRNCFKDLRL